MLLGRKTEEPLLVATLPALIKDKSWLADTQLCNHRRARFVLWNVTNAL